MISGAELLCASRFQKNLQESPAQWSFPCVRFSCVCHAASWSSPRCFPQLLGFGQHLGFLESMSGKSGCVRLNTAIQIKWFRETKILLDSNCCKDSIFPHTSCYETWGSWKRFDFGSIDVKHGSNMDHRTFKLEPWQLVPRPLTPGRLAFVNEDLWCTSTSRIDVLGRPKDSGICWTSLRNLETKTLSHNAIGTSWLTFVEIIHLQLPPKTPSPSSAMIPIGWLPLFCANNSMTSPAAPCWPRISAWNSLTIFVRALPNS